jgi:hypothetical protein
MEQGNLFGINEELSCSTPPQGAQRATNLTRKLSIQEESLSEELVRIMCATHARLEADKGADPNVHRQCAELDEVVKSIHAQTAANTGMSYAATQEAVSRLQAMLAQGATPVQDIINGLLLLLARLSRQHDYDAATLDHSRDLAAPHHVAASTSIVLSRTSGALSEQHSGGGESPGATVLCRICEERVMWEALEEHTRDCARGAKARGQAGEREKSTSIADFQVGPSSPY